MVRHVNQHFNDEFIILGKNHVRKEENYQKYVQSNVHHYVSDGKYSLGKQFTACQIILPKNVRKGSGKIRCRKCEKYSTDYQDDWTFQDRHKAVKSIMQHERSCKGKMSNMIEVGNGSGLFLRQLTY